MRNFHRIIAVLLIFALLPNLLSASALFSESPPRTTLFAPKIQACALVTPMQWFRVITGKRHDEEVRQVTRKDTARSRQLRRRLRWPHIEWRPQRNPIYSPGLRLPDRSIVGGFGKPTFQLPHIFFSESSEEKLSGDQAGTIKLPYRPEWLSSTIERQISTEVASLENSIRPLFERAQPFSSKLTHVVQSGYSDYANAIEIVRLGPDFNRLNEYPGTGRAFRTNIGPWEGALTHSPILQLSFRGRVIDEDTEAQIKRQIETFLTNHLMSAQRTVPRKHYSMSEGDYALTNYLFDLLLMNFKVDAVRVTKNDPLPLDWLLIKNPEAIEDISMVTAGVDAPIDWREEADSARQHAEYRQIDAIGDWKGNSITKNIRWLAKRAIFAREWEMEEAWNNRSGESAKYRLIEGHAGDYKAAYRGMRLTLDGIVHLLKNGLEPNKSSYRSLHFAPTVITAIEYAIHPMPDNKLRNIVPSRDFALVLVETHESFAGPPGVNRRMDLDELDAVYVYDYLDQRFVAIWRRPNVSDPSQTPKSGLSTNYAFLKSA